MMGTKIARWLLFGVVVALLLMPVAAFAQDGEEEPAGAVTEQSGLAGLTGPAAALAAGLAMGLSALAAGSAQGKIGAAAAGALAERPELFTNVIVFLVLPEIIVLLGFVIAMMLNTTAGG